MSPMLSRRNGFALPVAVFAIVIIGVLVAGGFFASTQEFRIGTNTIQQTRALGAAEFGLNQTHATWNVKWNTTMQRGEVRTLTPATSDGSVATVRVTRLNDQAFLVASEGSSGQARRRTAKLLVLNVPQLNMLAALTTRGATKIGGSSFIDGNDHNYAGWDCPTAGPPLPGIATSDTSEITRAGCGNYNCVAGSPKVVETPSAADTSTYFNFGSLDWAQLAAMANKYVIGGKTALPSEVNGACNEADDSNWGEPYKANGGPCVDYYPIIYAGGQLTMNGGRGQGILLVEGDLHVQGGFEFYGPVIVRGILKTSGTGGHFNGGVLAANVDLDQNVVIGNAVIEFSRCTLMKALNGSATLTTAVERAWYEVY
jgi:Tfp pilus assembly protein PilX